MIEQRTLQLVDETATEGLGAALGRACHFGCQIHLHGQLGAGKTTLVRGFLRALGHAGAVRSPTYTLIEPYDLGRPVYHLDLYRLSDPEELEYLGLRDLQQEQPILLVEWPDRGAGALPAPDLVIELAYAGRSREARLVAHTEQGRALLAAALATDVTS